MEENENLFLYMAQLLHEGGYNSGISWGQFLVAYENVSGESAENILQNLKSKKIIEGFSKDDAFIFFPSEEVKADDTIIEKILDSVSKISVPYHISLAFRLEPSLVDLILSFKFYNLDEHEWGNDEMTFIPIVLSPRFVKDERVQERLDHVLEKFSLNVNFRKYSEESWFIELIFMVKRGLYGNGGYSFVSSLSQARQTSLLKGSYDLLSTGELSELFLRFSNVMTDQTISAKMMSYQRKNKKSSDISAFYSYLSIANDVMIGIEFLAGSFDFLPTGIYSGASEVTGVYLFILGSAQLLIRSIIEISKRIHLHLLANEKIL
jgi:hypothetical protein